MKKNKNLNSAIRKKLLLNLQHIAQLTPIQMSDIQGASGGNWSCIPTVCGKSD